MHDEMGGVYETMYGRMSGMLGLSLTNSPIHVLIPYPYSSPPTDIVKGSIEVDSRRDAGGRDADLEDLPQRRGYAPDPHPLVHRAADQPRGPERPGGRRAGGSDRTGLEGHHQDQPAGGHLHRAAADRSNPVAGSVRGARQHPADRPRSSRGGAAAATGTRGVVLLRTEHSSPRSRTTSSTSGGSTCGTATSSRTKRWTSCTRWCSRCRRPR